mgnify:FL=1
MHDTDFSPTNFTPTIDTSRGIVQASGGINFEDPPEWFKKKAREMTQEEIWRRIVKSNQLKKETKQIIKQEIPDLIEYLDIIFPKQRLLGFKKFVLEREKDAK